MGVEIHDGTTLRISRSFDHPPETVYGALTEPDLVGQWMWTGLGSRPQAEIDLRVGERNRVAITADTDEDRWAEAHAQGTQASSDVLTAMLDEQA